MVTADLMVLQPSVENTAVLKVQRASYRHKEESLVQNVPTCWNSTFKMINWVQINKDPLKVTLAQQKMNTTGCQRWKHCWSHAGEMIPPSILFSDK